MLLRLPAHCKQFIGKPKQFVHYNQSEKLFSQILDFCLNHGVSGFSLCSTSQGPFE